MSFPAKFSDSIIALLAELLDAYGIRGHVLDPFAGTGRVHELASSTILTRGVELEEEWPGHERDNRTITGDARDLPFASDFYAAVVTSPPYANRMADNYAGDAKGSKRYTYRIARGKALVAGSIAAMQWGRKYRRNMLAALQECWRVLEPGGLLFLNISDHWRKGEWAGVPEWYEGACVDAGFVFVEVHEVETTRNGHGANRDARAANELVYVYRKMEVPE